MKKVLINNFEEGRVCDVVEPGTEFEVNSQFAWIDCDIDEITTKWSWSIDDSGKIIFSVNSIHETDEFKTVGYKVARATAFGSVQEQLDMIYEELKLNGTLSFEGPWAKHITKMKESIPKNNPIAVLEWYQKNHQ